MPFKFFELAFQGVDRFVHRLFESLRTVLGDQIFARHVQRNGGYLVSLFVVFIEFQNDLRSGRALGETVHLGHLRLYEIDEPAVGIDLH